MNDIKYMYWNHADSIVLNQELYTCRIQKFIFVHLFTDLFEVTAIQSDEWREILMKQTCK